MQLNFPVAAASYGSFAEMTAAHKERQARFSAAAIRPKQEEAKTAPAPLVADIPVFRISAKLSRPDASRKATKPGKRAYANIWEMHPTSFNHHVIVWRRHMLAQDMAACPDFITTPGFDERLPILEIVLEVLTSFPGVTVEDLKSSRRSRDIVLPRQIAMFEAYHRRKDLSLPSIGRWFGGRDHTTVLHAVRKIEASRAAA
jgi:hypothetical protein